MNKMKMYLKLEEWINLSGSQKGITIADAIYDSPFQTSEFSPYVVIAFLKNTPRKNIPAFVLDMLKDELVADNEFTPKKAWYQCFQK